MKYILISVIALISVASGQDFPTCNPNVVSWHPHPLTCERYLICFHGNIIDRECAPGLLFSRDDLKCTFPELANCDDGSNPCPAFDNEQSPLFVPNPESCNSYYVCFNGSLIPRTCAENLWWDIVNDWCTYEDVVTCDPRTPNNPNVPTTVPPVEVTTAPPTDAPTIPPPTNPPTIPPTNPPTIPPPTPNPDTMDCPLQPGTTYHPHTINCARYFICIDGVAFLRTCESGLLFDIVHRQCTEADVAHCISEI